jgi:hypothetical protein
MGKAPENTAVNKRRQSIADRSEDNGSAKGTTSTEINSSVNSADERSEDSWDFVFRSAQ